MINKFCVITTQRSGSNWLISLLKSHPELEVFGELFINEKRKDGTRRKFSNTTLPPFYEFRKCHYPVRPFSTFNYLNTLNEWNGNHKVIGFKLMYYDISHRPEIMVKIILDRYKIIHLIRDNYLDVTISEINAWGKKGAGIVHTLQNVKVPPVHINIETLLQKLYSKENKVNKYTRFLNFIPNPVMTVYYDSLCSEKDLVLTSIADFLDIQNNQDIKFVSNQKKINTGQYSEKIANYEEVKQRLKDTKFKKLID